MIEHALERVRQGYRFYVSGYVVMPEHVHLLVSEPERSTLAVAIQALKQSVARRLINGREHFWQTRYYDFNVWTKKKFIEKLRYIHENPVERGLVKRPEDWPWSSFCHYLTGEIGTVEIESHWTARRREMMGVQPRLRFGNLPHPSKVGSDGAPVLRELPHPSKVGSDGAPVLRERSHPSKIGSDGAPDD